MYSAKCAADTLTTCRQPRDDSELRLFIYGVGCSHFPTLVMVDAGRLRKSCAFSIDAILASKGSESPSGMLGDSSAVTADDGSRDSSKKTSVDDAWLRRLFSDVTRQFLVARSAADTGSLSSMCRGQEREAEMQRSTSGHVSTLNESKSRCPRLCSSYVSSWSQELQFRRSNHHDARTLDFDGRTSSSPDRRRRTHAEEPPHHGLNTTGVDRSGRPEHRRAKLDMVDGRQRPRSRERNEDDPAVGCYFVEESLTETDGGSQAPWLTELRHSLQDNHGRHQERSNTDNRRDVKKYYSSLQTDSIQIWNPAQSFNGNHNINTLNLAHVHINISSS